MKIGIGISSGFLLSAMLSACYSTRVPKDASPIRLPISEACQTVLPTETTKANALFKAKCEVDLANATPGISRWSIALAYKKLELAEKLSAGKISFQEYNAAIAVAFNESVANITNDVERERSTAIQSLQLREIQSDIDRAKREAEDAKFAADRAARAADNRR